MIVVFRPHQLPATAGYFRGSTEEAMEQFTDSFLNSEGCTSEDADRVFAENTIGEKFWLAVELAGRDLYSLTVLDTREDFERYCSERDFYGHHNKGLNAVTECARQLGWTSREYQIAVPLGDDQWEILEKFTADCEEAAVDYGNDHYDRTDWHLLDSDGRCLTGEEDYDTWCRIVAGDR